MPVLRICRVRKIGAFPYAGLCYSTATERAACDRDVTLTSLSGAFFALSKTRWSEKDGLETGNSSHWT
jgi:hypothetical protein